MRLDPAITVGKLLSAFPSARQSFHALGIDADPRVSVAEACQAAGLDLTAIEDALDRIDWTGMPPAFNPPAS